MRVMPAATRKGAAVSEGWDDAEEAVDLDDEDLEDEDEDELGDDDDGDEDDDDE